MVIHCVLMINNEMEKMMLGIHLLTSTLKASVASSGSGT
jgi:hypothetical protein